MRLRDLLERQAADLASLDEGIARRVLRIYDDARRELRERLETTRTPAGAQTTRVMLVQAEQAVLRLRGQLGVELAESERQAGEQALANLIGIAELAEPNFTDIGAQVEIATLARISDARSLALYRYSLDRYGADVVNELHRQLVVGVAAGETPQQLAWRLAGANGAMAGMAGRASLIARMELGRAYDTGAQASLEELASFDDPQDDDPLYKKADEFLDGRNHPFSLLLDGKLALPKEEWRVNVRGNLRARQGLVWTVTNGVAHGRSYPAHYHDRGRQVPWRKSWGAI
ncbi:MAG TPA: hypothetical protein VEB22_15535 [Phycisphaerales bacterium]|nr:hypothetical protein [Phycisphaerales bacterium]